MTDIPIPINLPVVEFRQVLWQSITGKGRVGAIIHRRPLPLLLIVNKGTPLPPGGTESGSTRSARLALATPRH